MGPVVTEIWSGGQNKKKVGAHFYFSAGAFFIASVDPPFKESNDPGPKGPNLAVLRQVLTNQHQTLIGVASNFLGPTGACKSANQGWNVTMAVIIMILS